MPFSPRNAARRRIWRARVTLAAFGLASGLLLGEVAARGLAWTRERSIRANWQRLEHHAAVPPDPATLGDLVRQSEDPRIVYEFIPGITGRFMGQLCHINAQGVRGDDWPPVERTPRTLRILGLGDSVMFGWGIAEPDCFLRVLERRLRPVLPDRDVQVLNTGVPGYNTAMEIAAFERRWSAWQPDIVILDYVGNDADLPNMIAGVSPLTDFEHSYLFDLLRIVMGRQRSQQPTLQPAPWAGDHFESDPERVPPQYRDMVGEAGVERALRRLAGLAAEHRFRAMVTCHYQAPPFVHRICADLGLPLVANEEAIQQALAANGQTTADYRRSDLVLSPDDIHPSARAHALYAATIAAFLQEHGWLRINPR